MEAVPILEQISQADIVFIVSGFLGMVSHYMKKYAKKQTKASITEWFGRNNLSGSLSSFGAFLVACVTALGSGVITPEMNLYAVIYAGLMTGFAVDSGFNSDKVAKRPKLPPKPQDN